MLAEHEPPPYDGPFNAWLLQFAQGQVGVHAGRVQEHQKQLSYHERQLRYWEQMTKLLQAGQGSTMPQSLPISPSPGSHSSSSSSSPRPAPPIRAESKQNPPTKVRAPPSFRNPFGGEDAGAEREHAAAAERERIERERVAHEQQQAEAAAAAEEEEQRRLAEEQLASSGGVEGGQEQEGYEGSYGGSGNGDQQPAEPDFPPPPSSFVDEPGMEPALMDAENAALEAEIASREAAEAEAVAAQAREEAERAAAEAEAAREAEEEEARRQEEARQQEAEEAERNAAKVPDYVEPEPEPAPPVATVTVATPPTVQNVGPAPRKPPSTSPGLHADAAAVAASTSLKERMARMGGLNPMAMMPGQGGMPMPRPRKVEDSGDSVKPPADEAYNRQPSAELKATQEFKPEPIKPSSPSTATTTNTHSNAATPSQASAGPSLVKGPAPPPRKPMGSSQSSSNLNKDHVPQRPTTDKHAADPHPPSAAKNDPHPPSAAKNDPHPPSKSDPHPPAKAAPAAEAKPTAATATATATATAASNKKYCKANFDLDHPPKGCPKFKKGDFAECVEVKGEWSHVIFLKNNEEGHVPTAYFSMDVALPATPSAAAPVVKKMKALFPFAPPKPKGFVPLKVGEIVTLEKGEPGEEWWVVKNAAGLSGYVPHNYVKFI